MLHEADPTDLENDPEELLHLEGKKNISYVYTSHYLKKSTVHILLHLSAGCL